MTELPAHVDHSRGLAARRAADRRANSVVRQARTARRRGRHRGAGDGGDRVRLAVEGARAGRRRRTGRRAASRLPRHRVLRAGGQPQRRQAGDRRGPATRSNTWCRRPTGTAGPTSGAPRAEATAQIAEIVAIAHDSGASVEVIIATAWDCPFDGPTPPQRVLDIVTAARDAGADRLAIADTIGTTTPRRVSDLIARVRPVIGDIPLGAHFHNTRGAGLASAYAAVSCRRHPAGRLGRRAGRLPVRPGRQRQHRHRGSGVPVAGQRNSTSTSTCRPRSPRPRVAQNVVGHDLPSALLRAGDRILG